jgi:hypothetical protein
MISKPRERYVVDGEALAAFFRGDGAAAMLTEVFERAEAGRADVAISILAYAHFLADAQRVYPLSEVTEKIAMLPLEHAEFSPAHLEQALALQREHGLSLGQGATFVLARDRAAILITGNRAVQSLGLGVNVSWI